MEVMLNSEIAKLVLGYLAEENLPKVHKKFCETSKYLKEEKYLLNKGYTTVSHSNLVEILTEYCEIKFKINQFFNSLPDKVCESRTYTGTLKSKLNFILTTAKRELLKTNPNTRKRKRSTSLCSSNSSNSIDLDDTVCNLSLPNPNKQSKKTKLGANFTLLDLNENQSTSTFENCNDYDANCENIDEDLPENFVRTPTAKIDVIKDTILENIAFQDILVENINRVLKTNQTTINDPGKIQGKSSEQETDKNLELQSMIEAALGNIMEIVERDPIFDNLIYDVVNNSTVHETVPKENQQKDIDKSSLLSSTPKNIEKEQTQSSLIKGNDNLAIDNNDDSSVEFIDEIIRTTPKIDIISDEVIGSNKVSESTQTCNSITTATSRLFQPIVTDAHKEQIQPSSSQTISNIVYLERDPSFRPVPMVTLTTAQQFQSLPFFMTPTVNLNENRVTFPVIIKTSNIQTSPSTIETNSKRKSSRPKYILKKNKAILPKIADQQNENPILGNSSKTVFNLNENLELKESDDGHIVNSCNTTITNIIDGTFRNVSNVGDTCESKTTKIEKLLNSNSNQINNNVKTVADPNLEGNKQYKLPFSQTNENDNGISTTVNIPIIEKGTTPKQSIQVTNYRKIKSNSTPRRRSHIRVLDFTTPGKHIDKDKKFYSESKTPNTIKRSNNKSFKQMQMKNEKISLSPNFKSIEFNTTSKENISNQSITATPRVKKSARKCVRVLSHSTSEESNTNTKCDINEETTELAFEPFKIIKNLSPMDEWKQLRSIESKHWDQYLRFIEKDNNKDKKFIRNSTKKKKQNKSLNKSLNTSLNTSNKSIKIKAKTKLLSPQMRRKNRGKFLISSSKKKKIQKLKLKKLKNKTPTVSTQEGKSHEQEINNQDPGTLELSRDIPQSHNIEKGNLDTKSSQKQEVLEKCHKDLNEIDKSTKGMEKVNDIEIMPVRQVTDNVKITTVVEHVEIKKVEQKDKVIPAINNFTSIVELLATPFKTDLSIIPITPQFRPPLPIEDTPITKILKSLCKHGAMVPENLDIFTPNFPITPGCSTTPPKTSEKSTPASGGFANRPTDYSSSGSYYRPDESDDVNEKFDSIINASRKNRTSSETENQNCPIENLTENLNPHHSDDTKVVPCPGVLERIKSFSENSVELPENVIPHYTFPDKHLVEKVDQKSSSSSRSSSSSSSSSSSDSTTPSINSYDSDDSSDSKESYHPRNVSTNSILNIVDGSGEIRYPIRTWITPKKKESQDLTQNTTLALKKISIDQQMVLTELEEKRMRMKEKIKLSEENSKVAKISKKPVFSKKFSHPKLNSKQSATNSSKTIPKSPRKNPTPKKLLTSAPNKEKKSDAEKLISVLMGEESVNKDDLNICLKNKEITLLPSKQLNIVPNEAKDNVSNSGLETNIVNTSSLPKKRGRPRKETSICKKSVIPEKSATPPPSIDLNNSISVASEDIALQKEFQKIYTNPDDDGSSDEFEDEDEDWITVTKTDQQSIFCTHNSNLAQKSKTTSEDFDPNKNVMKVYIDQKQIVLKINDVINLFERKPQKIIKSNTVNNIKENTSVSGLSSSNKQRSNDSQRQNYSKLPSASKDAWSGSESKNMSGAKTTLKVPVKSTCKEKPYKTKDTVDDSKCINALENKHNQQVPKITPHINIKHRNKYQHDVVKPKLDPVEKKGIAPGVKMPLKIDMKSKIKSSNDSKIMINAVLAHIHGTE